MKKYYKLGIILLIACLAYLVGNWIPIEYLKPKVTQTDIKSPEYYNILVGLASAIVTFFAVIVALFQQDIRKWWVHSKFEVKFVDDNKLTEMLEIEKKETSSESSSNHYKAEKYESVIYIENTGNETARNCEIYLDRIHFIGGEFTEKQNIKIKNSSVTWAGENDKKIIIPPKSKKSITIIELFEAKNQSLPNGELKQTHPELFIGGVLNPKEFIKGRWEAYFSIYSDDSNPYDFILELEWNGKWEQRFAEMKKCLKINLKH